MIVDVYEKDNRRAEIHKDETDYYVKLIENDIIVDIIKLENKSIQQAASHANNYIEHLGSFYQ